MTRKEAEEKIRAVQGERLNAVRKHYRRNITQFARELNADRTVMSLYINGRRTIPSDMLLILWDKYKVKPGEIIGTEKLHLKE